MLIGPGKSHFSCPRLSLHTGRWGILSPCCMVVVIKLASVCNACHIQEIFSCSPINCSVSWNSEECEVNILSVTVAHVILVISQKTLRKSALPFQYQFQGEKRYIYENIVLLVIDFFYFYFSFSMISRYLWHILCFEFASK